MPFIAVEVLQTNKDKTSIQGTATDSNILYNLREFRMGFFKVLGANQFNWS